MTTSSLNVLTRRAKDGALLWRCSECGVYLPRDLFAEHLETDPCCLACQVAGKMPSEGMFLPWLIGPLPPEEDEVFRRKAVWYRVQKYVRMFKYPENRSKSPIEVTRKRMLDKILFHTKQSVPETLRQPTLEVLAEYDLGPKDSLWLAMRAGLLSKLQLRKLAFACACQVCNVFKLEVFYPEVTQVINDIEQTLAYPESRTLNIPRHNIYSICKSMEQSLTKSAFLRVGDALMAACFPHAYDAATLAICAACEAYVDEGIEEVTALANLNDEVRTIAIEALKEYELPKLEHWTGLESL